MDQKDIKNDSVNHQDIPELSLPKNLFGHWSGFFIERYRIVFLLILTVFIVGISAYINLPRELQPEVTLPYGMVTTLYTGAAPDEVESLVTNKLESKLENIEDVKEMTSTSAFGMSNIFLEFEQGVDIDKKISEMREELSGIDSELPGEAEQPAIASLKTNNSPIMVINLGGDVDLVSITKVAEDIKDRLERENDVLEALVIGGVEREIRIEVDPLKLAAYGVSMESIKNAVSGSNVNFPGGTMVLDEKNFNLRTVGQIENPKELETVALTSAGGGSLYLRDVAVVKDAFKDEVSYSRMATGDDGSRKMARSVAISVKKKESADIIRTSDLIHKILKDEKGTLYPENMTLDVSGDTAEYVRDQLGAVINNSLSGLCLVMVVLFLFIGFGEAAVVSMVIPMAILLTMWMMKIAGLTLNTITLFSLILAVGMLVDNGIVIMENIDRLRFHGVDAQLAAGAATNQIAPAVASSTLTTLAAFFPLLLTSGIMGAYIKSIPMTVIFALTASFAVAMTFTPSMCSIFLKKHRSEVQVDHNSIKTKMAKAGSVLLVASLAGYAFSFNNEINILTFVSALFFGGLMFFKQFKVKTNIEESPIVEFYGEKLYGIVKNKKARKRILAFFLLAFVVSMALPIAGILKVEMFSGEDQNRFYVSIETPKGTTVDRTSEISEQVEALLLDVPEIKSFVANVGITGADSFDEFGGGGSNPTKARLIIDLVDKDGRDRTSMELAKDVRSKIENIVGAKITVDELENGPPTGAAVVVRLQGKDMEALKATAAEYVEVMKGIPGTRDVSSSVSDGSPELQVRVDKEKASRLGLNDIQVAMTIRNAVNGLKATTYRVNQEEIDVTIRLTDSVLSTKADLEKLVVTSPSGQAIRLGQIARIVEDKGYTGISHTDRIRQVQVNAQTRDGYLGNELTKEFQNRIASQPAPEGIKVLYGGEMESISESFGEMFVNMIVAAILVYLILAVQFNSLSQPIIILSTVPLAMIGVMPGLLLTGNNFGFVAFIGVVALVGIAVNNGIVLVDYINYLRASGYEFYDAIRLTGKTRFIPVLATTITTAGGILPITLEQEFFAGLGYTLIFGLSVSTLLTLLLVPILYAMVEERRIRRASGELKRFQGVRRLIGKLKLRGGKAHA